jgi:UDP-N-acetylglucosamine:LPS N-acetylglucosamine transferase
VVDNSATADELERVISGLLSDAKRRQLLAGKLAGTSKTGAAKELANLLLLTAGARQGSL